jgi:GNAT superfamily N-acetyltransferase
MNRKKEKIAVRPAEAHDYLRIEELAYHFWGEREVECFEARYDVSQLSALVAMSEGEVVGFLSYALEKEALVLVMLNILPAYQGHGGARALFKAAVREAKERGLSRLLVATSNDDLLALYLYQRWGFTLKACLVGKVAEHHGGVMPGFAGIGVRDELQLELGLK